MLNLWDIYNQEYFRIWYVFVMKFNKLKQIDIWYQTFVWFILQLNLSNFGNILRIKQYLYLLKGVWIILFFELLLKKSKFGFLLFLIFTCLLFDLTFDMFMINGKLYLLRNFWNLNLEFIRILGIFVFHKIIFGFVRVHCKFHNKFSILFEFQ